MHRAAIPLLFVLTVLAEVGCQTQNAPADSENAPADSENAPADSENAPADSENAAADSENAAADSENAAADSENAAAGTASKAVAFTTGQQTYAPGDTVTLRLESGGASFEYNLCYAILQRRTESGWTRVTLPGENGTAGACTAIAYILKPSETATYIVPLDSALSKGTYRFTADVRRPASDAEIAISTSPFRVEPK